VQQQIVAQATSAGLDPQLALAIANEESGFNPGAVGTKGELGVFQLMPATAAGLNVDPSDPSQNIQGGVSYLNQMLSQFGGNMAQAAAAYNCGPGCVQNAIAQGGSNWMAYLPASTQAYVASVVGSVGGSSPVSVSDDDSGDVNAGSSFSWEWIAAGVAALLVVGLALSD
jgi:soluble lytic murein transglycosylase-like protein